jgi:hypothetical protein
METFPFVNHVPTHVYPKGDSFRFGKGYEHSAAPQDPLQRRFTLSFNLLIWYRNGAGVFDATIDVENNALAMDEFYALHRSHKKFLYAHPVYGTIICKFAADAPFEMPRGLEGGSGATEGFSLVLVEQPL